MFYMKDIEKHADWFVIVTSKPFFADGVAHVYQHLSEVEVLLHCFKGDRCVSYVGELIK